MKEPKLTSILGNGDRLSAAEISETGHRARVSTSEVLKLVRRPGIHFFAKDAGVLTPSGLSATKDLNEVVYVQLPHLIISSSYSIFVFERLR